MHETAGFSHEPRKALGRHAKLVCVHCNDNDDGKNGLVGVGHERTSSGTWIQVKRRCYCGRSSCEKLSRAPRSTVAHLRTRPYCVSAARCHR